MISGRYGKALTALILVLLLTGCALPVVDHGSPLRRLSPDEARETRVGQAVMTLETGRPGETGVYTLTDPLAAFAARVLLISSAERTLDLQYYIWQEDTTGMLLLGQVLDAAERGVRVRMLLDDNGIGGLDPLLAAMATHPNVHIRLFNPFSVRSAKWLNFITSFSRVNRRMHNKSLTADNMLTILGGRNIGDEYFGATPGALFVDLDVLALGPAVDSVSEQFDHYWTSQSAYPLSSLVGPVGTPERLDFRARVKAVRNSDEAEVYLEAVRQERFLDQLLDGELEIIWSEGVLVSDDPDKVLGKVTDDRLLLAEVGENMWPPGYSLDLVSPYFVPTEAGVALFRRLEEQGIEVRILTNSAAATDVLAVHSGYARHREELLEAGVELYEMKPVGPRQRSRGSGPGSSLSSSSSLHAKTFAMDGDRVFIGSFNFDPRSHRLNTEMGLILNSRELAQRLANVFGPELTLRAYRVELDEDGDLVWTDSTGEVMTDEPGTDSLDRGMLWFFSVMPIEGLL